MSYSERPLTPFVQMKLMCHAQTIPKFNGMLPVFKMNTHNLLESTQQAVFKCPVRVSSQFPFIRRFNP